MCFAYFVRRKRMRQLNRGADYKWKRCRETVKAKNNNRVWTTRTPANVEQRNNVNYRTLGLLQFPLNLKKKIIVRGWPACNAQRGAWASSTGSNWVCSRLQRGKIPTRKSRHNCCLLFLKPNAKAVSVVFSAVPSNHLRGIRN